MTRPNNGATRPVQERILCACGCGQTLLKYRFHGPHGKYSVRRFHKGHGKLLKNKLDDPLVTRPFTLTLPRECPRCRGTLLVKDVILVQATAAEIGRCFNCGGQVYPEAFSVTPTVPLRRQEPSRKMQAVRAEALSLCMER